MRNRSTKRQRGFSLLEMVVATALGTVVVGAAVQLYVQGVSATWVVSQRAEMQQDFRAASNMLTKDLSLAGAGLGNGAEIQLPTSSTIPIYGCDQSKCYLPPSTTNGVQYPKQSGTPYLYGLVPGYNAGPTLSGQPTDTVTVVYTDPAFYLDCYTAAITGTATVVFTQPTVTSANCTANSATVQNVNDTAVGLTAGDLVLFCVGNTSPCPQVIAEVTGAVTQGTNGSGQTTFTVPFATSDKLNMNQAAAVPQTLASKYVASPLTTAFGSRILVITYYIDNTVTPSRLMRQISGHTPMPVAESVAYMKFTYDLFNASTNTPAVGCSNPGASAANPINGVTTDGCSQASAGLLPNQITKINVQNMAIDSSLQGSSYGMGKGYQTLDLETSVSARNLTYINNYPN